jgi:hypothetical protein
MTVSIGLLQPQEVPAFCALFQRVFSVSLTPALRQWKYEQGPRLGSVSLVARDASGALVGHAGALIFPGTYQGRILPMAQVCDVMVEAEARGGLDAGGTYGRLMQALQHELARRHPGVLAYGFAGIRPYKLGARMGLYRAVQECRMGFLEDLPPAGGSEAAAVSAAVASVQRVWGTTAPWAWAAQRADWDHPAFARLWARWGVRGECPRVQRTPAYLQWRYATHPQHRYQPWLLRRWGRAQGWVVTRDLPDGSRCLVDSLLPAGLSPVQAAQAVQRSLSAPASVPNRAHSYPVPSPRVSSWDIRTDVSARLEPIMACEVLVDRWHSDQVTPQFQPGDTDVF